MHAVAGISLAYLNCNKRSLLHATVEATATVTPTFTAVLGWAKTDRCRCIQHRRCYWAANEALLLLSVACQGLAAAVGF